MGAFVRSKLALGTPVSRSDNTVYQAEADGFFAAVITAGSNTSVGKVVAFSDSSNPPTTEVAAGNTILATGAISQTTASNKGGFNVFIKRGNYYKGVLTSSFSGSTATVVYTWTPML